MTIFTAACFLLLALALPGWGQNAPGTLDDIDRFYLFGACRPMSVMVYASQSGPVRFKLSREVIEAAAKLRLKAARLYPAPHPEGPVKEWPPALVIDFQMVGHSFHINLAYSKPVSDHLSGLDFMAATWLTGFIGQHTGNPEFVMQALDQMLDRFVAEYLRVNREACDKGEE